MSVRVVDARRCRATTPGPLIREHARPLRAHERLVCARRSCVRGRVFRGEAWQYLGATGVKRFTDESLPAGTTWAEYTITARRGSSEGHPRIRRLSMGAVSAPVLRAAA